MRRFLTTLVALLLLAVVLKFLPPISKPAVQASRGTIPVGVADLRLSGVQITPAADGRAVYLDGIVTNVGNGHVSEATSDVGFHDARGRLVASVREKLVGMSHGGTDLVDNEFKRNPITPHQMRFFRVAVAVEDVPPAWNHEVPDLSIVEVKAK